jgi:hypothetical protein
MKDGIMGEKWSKKFASSTPNEVFFNVPQICDFLKNCLLQHATSQVILHALHYLSLDLHEFLQY